MINFNNISAREIVDLVKDKTGAVITISLKSKKNIIIRAKKIFKEKGILFIESELKTKPESKPKKTRSFLSVEQHKAKEIEILIKEFEYLIKRNLSILKQALLEINKIK